MEASQIYIFISIVTLLVIAVLIFFVKKKKKKLTPLEGFAFAFVLAGILFNDSRIIGYSLMGMGIILSIIDIIKNKRK